jgi:hypothetical protein
MASLGEVRYGGAGNVWPLFLLVPETVPVPVILFPLFRLAGVGGCNTLRAQALFKYSSLGRPPPSDIFLTIRQ